MKSNYFLSTAILLAITVVVQTQPLYEEKCDHVILRLAEKVKGRKHYHNAIMTYNQLYVLRKSKICHNNIYL
jgi:hypothetical protein